MSSPQCPCCVYGGLDLSQGQSKGLFYFSAILIRYLQGYSTTLVVRLLDITLGNGATARVEDLIAVVVLLVVLILRRAQALHRPALRQVSLARQGILVQRLWKQLPREQAHPPTVLVKVRARARQWRNPQDQVQDQAPQSLVQQAQARQRQAALE